MQCDKCRMIVSLSLLVTLTLNIPCIWSVRVIFCFFLLVFIAFFNVENLPCCCTFLITLKVTNLICAGSC